MSKLPVVAGKDVVRALEKAGFILVRQHGSHMIMSKKSSEKSLTAVIPNHREIARGTLRSILRQAKISPEDLVKLLTLIIGFTPLMK